MKRILLALLITSTPALAEDSPAPVAAEELDTFALCKQFSEFAKTYQRLNQKGGSMADVYGIIQKMEISDLAKDAHMGIVKDAFEVPSYSIEKNQQREITKFENLIFMTCIDTFEE